MSPETRIKHVNRLNQSTDLLYEAMMDDDLLEITDAIEEVEHVLNQIKKSYEVS